MVRIYTAREVKCPVCSALIGYRKFDEPKAIDCTDCEYTWFYKSKKVLPIGMKHGGPVKKKQECGCGRCGR
jgi:hypothetical protein